MVTYKWARQKTEIKKTIRANFDSNKEWRQDKRGYFLIKVNHKQKQIEVGFVTNKHIISKRIIGTNAIGLYHTIIREKLISRMEHAAYLGKEFYKAELALRYGKKYVQEGALSFKDKIKVRIKVKS